MPPRTFPAPLPAYALIVGILTGCHARPAASPEPPPPPPPQTQPTDREPARIEPTVPVDAMLREAVKRLLAAMPASGNFTILLTIGPGEPAAQAAADLRQTLARDPRISFATATREPGPPVADAGTPGGHVNTVEWRVEPPPQLVVHVSEKDGLHYVAARLPAGDPLGPPTHGWLWVLSGR